MISIIIMLWPHYTNLIISVRPLAMAEELQAIEKTHIWDICGAAFDLEMAWQTRDDVESD